MASPFSIASVIIPEPNIPVRDLEGVADCRAANFTIWESTSPSHATPVSIAIGSEKTTIDVTFLGPIPPGGTFNLSGKFIGKFLKEPALKTSLTIESTEFRASDTKVSVTVTGFPADIPWGIRDTIEWRVGGETPTETPIELYAITPYKFIPAYFRGEVPLEFLRLFLLHILPLKIQNHAGFIKYAVAICLKSSHCEEDSKVEAGSEDIPTIHAYRYNNKGGGSSSFVGELGGSFALTDWLRNRIACRTRTISTVNCYDQTGIVTLVVALGLPSSDMKLRWYLMRPYGYIDADLVGVGKCNNPYFGEGPQLDHTQADSEPHMKNLTSPRRSGFSEHVFAGIETAGEVRIMDACAGEHFGTQSLEEYVAAAINRENIPEDPRSAEEIAADPTNPEEGETDTEKEGLAEKVLRAAEKRAVEKAGVNQRTKFSRRGKVRNAHWFYRSTPDKKPYGIESLRKFIAPRSYESLSESDRKFVDKIQASSTCIDNNLKYVNLKVMTSNITKALQEKGFHEFKDGLEDQKAYFRWSRQMDNEIVTVSLIFEESYHDALRDLNTSLLSYTKRDSERTKIEGNRYLAGPDAIRWVDSHVLVSIIRTSPPDGEPRANLNDIADIIHSFMSNAAKGPKLQERGGVVIEPRIDTQFPVVDKEFSITITAPKGSEINAFIIPNDNELRCLLIRDVGVETVDNSRTIRVVPLSEGTHSIKFSCAHWQTLEVSEKMLDITVGKGET